MIRWEGTWGGFPTRHVDVFEGLAAGSGFSIRDCHVAAQTGRLAGIARVYEQQKRSGLGTLSGAEALRRLARLERSPVMLLAELDQRRQ